MGEGEDLLSPHHAAAASVPRFPGEGRDERGPHRPAIRLHPSAARGGGRGEADQKRVKELGAGDIKVTLQRFSGTPAMNEALLSGTIDWGALGLPGLLIVWEKTLGRQNVKGLVGMPLNAFGSIRTSPPSNPSPTSPTATRSAVRFAITPKCPRELRALKFGCSCWRLVGMASKRRIEPQGNPANSCDGLVIDQSARLPTPGQRRDSNSGTWDFLYRYAAARRRSANALKLLPLAGHNRHGRTSCWLDSVANDP